MAVRKIDIEVSDHFKSFIEDWNYRTYCTVGGYGSGKSYNIALKITLKLLSEKRKCLVVRKVYATLRDSTFALFKDIIANLDLPEGTITAPVSPLGIKFSNGSEIVFKGLDDKEKIKSIHNISIIWIEESSELAYGDYKELLGRARHPEHSIHFLLSTNPVGRDNWVYLHFFIDDRDPEKIRITLDDEKLYEERIIIDGNTYYHHSTAEDNPFLPISYIEQLDELEEYDPDLHRIAKKGEFGITGTKVLPQFETMNHEKLMQQVNRLSMKRTGMDFGFQTSYNAALRVAIDHERKWLYIYWEFYKNQMTDDYTAADPKFMELKETGELIRADNAEPKTIQFYKQEGYRMTGAKKLTNVEQIKKVKRFKKIICSKECRNTIRELKNLTFKEDKNGNIIEDEFNIDAHTFDALKYSLEGYEVSSLKGDAVQSMSKKSLGI